MSVFNASHVLQDKPDFFPYKITNSLRLSGVNSDYLRRTPSSASNRTTFTHSFWMKVGGKYTLNGGSSSGVIFGAYSGTPNNDSEWFSTSTDNDGHMYIGAWTQHWRKTNRKFEDTQGWVHVVVRVDTTQATANDRVRLYINGTQETSFATLNNPSQNQNMAINMATQHQIGRINYNTGTGPYWWHGHLAEFHHIDGQSIGPDTFGETKYGVWIPKQYNGVHGPNGFYMKFNNASNLGQDSSQVGGGDYESVNVNGGDFMFDSPTNNFSILRVVKPPLESGAKLSEGNLKFETSNNNSARNQNRMAISHLLVKSGKWYAEGRADNTNNCFFGVGPYQSLLRENVNNSRYAFLYVNDGNTYVRTAGSESVATYGGSGSSGDVIGIYLDMDSSPPKVAWSKNGQWANGSGSWNQASPTAYINLDNTFLTAEGSDDGVGFMFSSSGGGTNAIGTFNFGQDSSFNNAETAATNTDKNGNGQFKYAVPTDALALCADNFPEPEFSPLKGEPPVRFFKPYEHTGAGSAGASFTGMGFRPDFLWTKERTQNVGGGNFHYWMDSTRGANNILQSNTTGASSTGDAWTFEDDGFSFKSVYGGGGPNQSTEVYSTLAWKVNGGTTSTNSDGSIDSTVQVNQRIGTSIVQWTSSGSGTSTIGHGLGKRPELIIAKRTDNTSNWAVIAPKTSNGYLLLNGNAGVNNGDTSIWNNTTPTTSVFSAQVGSGFFASGTFVAFCFADIDGYQKVGVYKGNDNADGPFVYCGFRPAMVIIKKTGSGTAANWRWHDITRMPVNSSASTATYGGMLEPNGSGSAYLGEYDMDFYCDGFKLRDSSTYENSGADSFMFWAIADQPFKYANGK